MSSHVSKILDPTEMRYFRINHIGEIYEALLCGLCVMQPAQMKSWIIEKLSKVEEIGISDLYWDSFIDAEFKPSHPFVIDTAMTFIFHSTGDDGPRPEMFIKAYNLYNMTLKRKYFNAIVQFHLYKRESSLEKIKRLKLAVEHYKIRKSRIVFRAWRKWIHDRLNRQNVSYEILQKMRAKSTCQTIFKAWQSVSQESKKTREYFEKELRKLERGEAEFDEDAAFAMDDGYTRDDVSKMPINISALIFSYLSIIDLARCAQVCRSWKVAAHENEIWNKIDFSRIRQKITDQVACRLLQRARPIVSHLNLRLCSHLSYPTFRNIAECKNLQEINFSQCDQVDDDLLKLILTGCPVLIYLNLSYTKISDDTLKHLAKYSTSIQSLSLAGCNLLTDDGFSQLCTQNSVEFSETLAASNFLYLDLSDCAKIRHGTFKHLGSVCHNVRHWILNDLVKLTDEDIEAIMKKSNNVVEHVELLGCTRLTDTAIRTISSNCRQNLHTLRLESTTRLTDAAWRDFSKLLADHITQLHITDCTKLNDLGLKWAVGQLRQLKVLNLADCLRITDAGVRHIAESPSCTTLRELNLTNCIRITDVSLTQLHKKCPNLIFLSICFCEYFTESGMEALGTMENLRYLEISGTFCGDSTMAALGLNSKFKSLNVSHCTNLTDLGVQRFVQNCRDIEMLDMSFCHQLTDGVVKTLAFCCRFLTVLNLAGCRQLTDLTVQYLSGVCHYLRQLNLSGCIMFTDKSLYYVKKGCRRMKKLTILYCKGISKKAVMKLSQTIPDIEFSQADPPDYYGY